MPRVSVLLTCYNHIRYLPAALQSVVDQSYNDYEIIAVDDGSTDGTREWLAARPEPIQKLFNEENLGTYGSLNAALAKASGEFVAVLNDDDVWAPEKLAKQVALLDSDPKVGLVHTDGEFIDGEGKVVPGKPLGFRFPTFVTGDILLGLVYENKIIASAALFRRRCVDELGGFNPEYFGSGDWEMWFRIAMHWKVGFVPEPLTYYRVHGENASHKLERIWRDDEKLRKWIAEQLERIPSDRFPAVDLRMAKAHNQACLGTVLALNGDSSSARSAYRKSMGLAPGRLKNYLRYATTYLPRTLLRRTLH